MVFMRAGFLEIFDIVLNKNNRGEERGYVIDLKTCIGISSKHNMRAITESQSVKATIKGVTWEKSVKAGYVLGARGY